MRNPELTPEELTQIVRVGAQYNDAVSRFIACLTEAKRIGAESVEGGTYTKSPCADQAHGQR